MWGNGWQGVIRDILLLHGKDIRFIPERHLRYTVGIRTACKKDYFRRNLRSPGSSAFSFLIILSEQE